MPNPTMRLHHAAETEKSRAHDESESLAIANEIREDRLMDPMNANLETYTWRDGWIEHSQLEGF
jgi:hypothetical protein